MRKLSMLLLAILALLAQKSTAQTIATFESPALPHADTFYTNFTASGTDVGFNSGLAHFPCVYDTSFGGFWEQGFAFSNMTDSITSGFGNQYAAKTAAAHSGTQYVTAYCYNPATFENNVRIKLIDTAIGHPVKGFYVTNSTYAYNSMRDGDMFARKFHNGDWFKLYVKGWSGGSLKADSVGVYLANFLHPDSNDNYILRTWEWVNLEPLGKVDSLQLYLVSTDNGAFGMNTPAYFCMDDFTTYESYDTTTPTTRVFNAELPSVKLYPVPTTHTLNVDINGTAATEISIIDLQGRTVQQFQNVGAHNELDITNLAPGSYVLLTRSISGTATARFTRCQ
ncbi:MAG: DUF4465 domain-containing protein [Taibaiella sp.]|nr:DUF4465 domain-containing protein [Taibaiella sp.]